jgi:hypothetical protein
MVELEIIFELLVVPMGSLDGGTYIDPDIYIIYSHI